MATQITNYQCPNCTGPLHFGGGSGQLECDFCGAKFDVAVIERLYADKDRKAAAAGTDSQWDLSMTGGNWSAEEAANMRGYICPSCAAEIICDATTSATSCLYCGNPTVVPGQFTGQLRPDYVVPFKLDKEAAVAALKNYYKGKKFLPKTFADTNHINEIRGIYVPFWLFDGESDATMRFLGTRIHKHKQGEYEVTQTEHYRITREGRIAFRKVPVDGSSKMPDAHMDAVEPFDYGELKQFSPAYLPGFLAEKYDVDMKTSGERADKRIRTSTERAFMSSATGYVTLNTEFSRIDLKRGDVKYALMPVYMLSTKWNGKDHLFAMNGQTGRLIGDLPIDRGRYWTWFATIALPLMAILGVLLFTGGAGV